MIGLDAFRRRSSTISHGTPRRKPSRCATVDLPTPDSPPISSAPQPRGPGTILTSTPTATDGPVPM